MTYIEDYRPLVRWFLNLKQNIQNKEPLLLLFNLNKEHEQIQLIRYIEQLNIFIKNLNSYVAYKILNLSDIEHIDAINPSENTLLVSHSIIPIDKIRNSHTIVLYYNLSHNDLKKIINFNFESPINYIIVAKFSRGTYYIEQRDPIEYIQQNYATINSIISFYGMKFLGSKQNLNAQVWKDIIYKEIHILLYHNILTAQLAIVIYKACTLQFYDSNTKIGRYYYSQLGVRSKTMQLPNVDNKKYKIQRRLAKAYDLNESPIDNFYISRERKKLGL